MDLGYACLNMSLEDVSPGRRTTVGYLKKLNQQEKFAKLNSLVERNLRATFEILKFNKEHNIKMYRISSDIVPLATHQITEDWDYLDSARDKLKEIGAYIKENKLRVSMHPGQYTVLNSKTERVVENAIADLNYHNAILEAMGLDDRAIIILHIGGVYGEKEKAIKRFKDNFHRLDDSLKSRLVIENDDTSYQAREVLEIAKELAISMVFDLHHFNCNHGQDEDLEQLLPEIFATWKNKPKVHFSSPASQKKYKSHADYIDAVAFDEFVECTQSLGLRDFDVMLECKKKDQALLKLRKESKVINNI